MVPSFSCSSCFLVGHIYLSLTSKACGFPCHLYTWYLADGQLGNGCHSACFLCHLRLRRSCAYPILLRLLGHRGDSAPTLFPTQDAWVMWGYRWLIKNCFEHPPPHGTGRSEYMFKVSSESGGLRMRTPSPCRGCSESVGSKQAER